MPDEDSINHGGIVENGIIYWDNTGENFDLSGSFEAIEGSIYDPKNLTWQPPTPLQFRKPFGEFHLQ